MEKQNPFYAREDSVTRQYIIHDDGKEPGMDIPIRPSAHQAGEKRRGKSDKKKHSKSENEKSKPAAPILIAATSSPLARSTSNIKLSKMASEPWT